MGRRRRKNTPKEQESDPQAQSCSNTITAAPAAGGPAAGGSTSAASTSTSFVPWGEDAPAKQHLRELLNDETSWVHDEWKKEGSQAARIRCIQSKCPLFKQYPEKMFYTNFRNLKETIDEVKIAIQFDRLAFDKEEKKWPITSTLPSGKARWADSNAQNLLRKDLKSLEKKKWKPLTLYNEREEYRVWSLEEFRNFHKMEKKWETQGVYWQAQRNKDMRKKAVETTDVGLFGEQYEK